MNICQLLKGKFDQFRQLFAQIFDLETSRRHRQCRFTLDDCAVHTGKGPRPPPLPRLNLVVKHADTG